MKEGGRSIVWSAVDEVLTKWSNYGKIGTTSTRNYRDQRASMETLKESWQQSGKTGFQRLHRDQIDDICAEVSAAIELMLGKLEAKDKDQEGKPKRSPFRVLTGGKDDKEVDGA